MKITRRQFDEALAQTIRCLQRISRDGDAVFEALSEERGIRSSRLDGHGSSTKGSHSDPTGEAACMSSGTAERAVRLLKLVLAANGRAVTADSLRANLAASRDTSQVYAPPKCANESCDDLASTGWSNPERPRGKAGRCSPCYTHRHRNGVDRRPGDMVTGD